MAGALIGGLLQQGFAPVRLGRGDRCIEARGAPARHSASRAPRPGQRRPTSRSCCCSQAAADARAWRRGRAAAARRNWSSASPPASAPRICGAGSAATSVSCGSCPTRRLWSAPACPRCSPCPARCGRAARVGAKHPGGRWARLWVEREAYPDAVTAVSGSGPAYVFYLSKPWSRRRWSSGCTLPRRAACSLETFLGAARLAGDSRRARGPACTRDVQGRHHRARTGGHGRYTREVSTSSRLSWRSGTLARARRRTRKGLS